MARDGSGQTAAGPRTGQPRPPIESELASLGSRLATLHDKVGIQTGQEPAWREFVDAMATATRREQAGPVTAAPVARLRARERDLSERIVALRAVGTALSRLGALLDETQRRSLSDGVAPLLDAM